MVSEAEAGGEVGRRKLGELSTMFRGSTGHAQRFLSAFGPIREHFCPRRHRLRAEDYRRERAYRFQVWNEVTGLQTTA